MTQLTVVQAATLAGVTARTMQNWAHGHKIGENVQGRILIDSDKLAALLAEQRDDLSERIKAIRKAKW